MQIPKPPRQPRILGLGEVLWDVFPDGETFGGAPANFACHCRSLGADAAVVSAVGDDERGRRAVAFLKEHGVDPSHIQVLPNAPTGAVLVHLDTEGKAEYQFLNDTAWDRIAWTSALADAASRADALCFGTLGQRSAHSRATIERFLRATRSDCLRVFDINLRQHFHSPELVRASLKAANVLKVNDEELPVMADWFALPGKPEQQLEALLDRFPLDLAILTCGPRGAWMISREESNFASPPPVDVVSTVGAGDAFTAAVVMGLLVKRPLDEINRRANAIAAYVCTQQGAVPPLPASLV